MDKLHVLPCDQNLFLEYHPVPQVLVYICAVPNICCILTDPAWIQNVHINLPATKRRAEQLGLRRTVKKQWQVGIKVLNVSLVFYTDFNILVVIWR